MDDKQERIRVRVDAYTRTCLTVIAVLLTVLALGLWAEAVPSAGPAFGAGAVPAGGIPDAGQQRERAIKEMEKVSAKLDQLIQLFQSGKAKVQVADAGKDAGKDRGGEPGAK